MPPMQPRECVASHCSTVAYMKTDEYGDRFKSPGSACTAEPFQQPMCAHRAGQTGLVVSAWVASKLTAELMKAARGFYGCGVFFFFLYFFAFAWTKFI